MARTPDEPDAVPPIIRQHDDEALSAEQDAAKASAGPVHDQLDAIVKAFTLRWVRLFGELRSQQAGQVLGGVLRDLRAALATVVVNPTAALRKAARQAFTLGRQQAFTEAGLDVVELADAPVDPETAGYIRRVVAAARRLIARAVALAGSVRRGSFAVVNRIMSVARQAANRIDRAARTVTNIKVNAGIKAVTKELRARDLWVAERDACVTCLALSGHLSDPETGLFDDSLTFGRRPVKWLPGATEQPDGKWAGGELDGPPRHPNCRCRTTPWFGHDTAGAESITHDWAGAIAEARANGDLVAEAAAHKAAAAARKSAAIDLPAALRREAERSVLNGWALPSEPNSTRMDAAERLLSTVAGRGGFSPSGWKVPTSVRKGAEKDLKKGTFHTRSFPGP